MSEITTITAKKIIAYHKGIKRWEAENFGKVWVVWNFNDKNLKNLFEIKWDEFDKFLSNWKREHKGFSLEFNN